MRTFLAGFLCLALIGAGLVATAYFSLQGKAGDNSVVAQQIEANIIHLIGDGYKVELPETAVDFSNFGAVAVAVNDVSVIRQSDNLVVATFDRVSAGADLLSIITGGSSFKSLKISGLVLDAGALSRNAALPFPPFLDRSINGLGTVLASLERELWVQGFEQVEIVNSEIRGEVGGRRETSPLKIDQLLLQHDGQNAISVSGAISTAISNVSIAAGYTRGEEGRNNLNVLLSGLDAREWFDDPASKDGIIGMNSRLNLSGEFDFLATDDVIRASDPKMIVQVGPGTLRVGPVNSTEIEGAELNLAIYLDRNQIELEKSYLKAGDFSSELIGGVKPNNEAIGYKGDLLYDFIIERATFKPVLDNEPEVPAAFQVAGLFEPKNRIITAEKIILTTQEGAVTGSASVDLNGETPAVVGRLDTDGISALALKQYWPFFVADKARNWIHDHIISGRVEKGIAEIDIPAGILFRLKDGQKFAPEHLKTSLEVRDFAFRPFGDMPPIEEGSGIIRLEGMRISADLESGVSFDGEGGRVKILSASFAMPDFAAVEKTGEASLELEGDLKTIARISDREPLRVMERMKVKPGQFSGKGHADVAATFPIGGKISYDDVKWNVLLETRSGESVEPLAGRRIADANLLIDANPKGANVTGSAKVDGVLAKLRLTEPIGKSGEVTRARTISATLSEGDREKLGFDLKPVVSGPLSIVIEQTGNSETHKIDFTESSISLPWIGWRKGEGVAADGKFDLIRKKDVFNLEDFSLNGPGFTGKGSLVLTKGGLQSANLTTLKLNETDDIQLKIKREGEAYNINATGLSFDVRSILNTLIHSGGFANAQGGRSVNLVANFETVRGFNNRIMRNALLLYESDNGRLRKLDVSANGSDGRIYGVQAQRNGDDTLFSMQTNDAGNALAFTDIYTRMEGGELKANLLQSQAGPFLGPVRVTGFNVINEPRLARLASNIKAQVITERGQLRRDFLEGAEDRVVRFQLAEGSIERGKGYLRVDDGIVRSSSMGLTVSGNLYDPNDRVNLSGTFMPANGINLAVSAIPILGQLLSNGRDNALIGISYQLEGSRRDPVLQINPLSIVTPGVFNRVFEFQR